MQKTITALVLLLIISVGYVYAADGNYQENEHVRIKGEDFDVKIYRSNSGEGNLPFISLEVFPQLSNDYIDVALSFKNTGSVELVNPVYTWEGKPLDALGNLPPGSSEKFIVSVDYSGEGVIIKKASVEGCFEPCSTNYYIADYTIKFYVLDGKVSAQVVENVPNTGTVTTGETKVKRILPDIYEVLDAISSFKNSLPFMKEPPSKPYTPAPEKIVIEKVVKEEEDLKEVVNGTKRVKIEYHTVIQKVSVIFREGERDGFRIIHNVSILESSAEDSNLWVILYVSKDVVRTTSDMIIPEKVTIIEEDPIVGLGIEAKEGEKEELDTTVITFTNETGFLRGTEIDHVILPKKPVRVSVLGQELPATHYILAIAIILSSILVFISLKKRL